MAKTSKRARKFVAKGGAKAMLDKGTILKKGKMKKRRNNKSNNDGNDNNPLSKTAAATATARLEQERQEKREKEDLLHDSKLGDMDMEDFLKSVADGDDESDDNEVEENEEGDAMMDDDSEEDESDEDVDDEEDLETAEQRMKEEMAKLAESDPDFHKYLQETDSSLLDFKGVSEEKTEADESMNDGDGKSTNDESNDKSQYIQFDAKLLKSYEQSAFKSHGLKGLKRIITAFKNACHMADPDGKDSGENDRSASNNHTGGKAYVIESSTVFDKLMVLCLTKCHEEFYYHLLGKGALLSQNKDETNISKDTKDDGGEIIKFDENKPIHPRQIAKAAQWTSLKPVINTFLKATLHLLSEAKESKLVTFILKSLSKYLPYLPSFPRVAKALLKSTISLWSSTNDSSSDYQKVRLNAFLRIRQLALTQPFPFIEQCLKSSYLAYARRSKFASGATVTSLLPTLTFMGNCVVELYSLDYTSSYQHAFIYIRQMTLHLRSAMQKKTPETFRVVYCWQYIHCLKLWTAVLSSACLGGVNSQSNSNNTDDGMLLSIDPKDADDETKLLRSLIYPLTEIIFGTIKLIPTCRFLPLRLHCVRLLQQLAASSGYFIPTTSILLDVFDLRELSMKPKRVTARSGSNVRGVRLPLIIKLPKQDTLRTVEQLDACISEVFLLLNREADLYRYSPGFPEFSICICQRLRKFAKQIRNGKYRAYAKGCITLCDKYTAFVVQARSQLEEAPKDIKHLEVLKPNNEPSMSERYDSAIAKEKRLEAAMQPAIDEKSAIKASGKRDDNDDIRKGKDATSSDVAGKKQKEKSKKKLAVNMEDLKNVGALEEQDKVAEGINWSESEEDDEGPESYDVGGDSDSE
eukprot:CAMPEP_0184860358 /NCGR_PEP_ID=MMETSP0580-20130426/5250_1 /TAXON_ID=1118495 /ORGANISM="Dactyliosolen fragilissimus" /LENGTH=862 /DNA_ID=CAMNT_0027357427 /DNA_START=76 /DNA_END=2664 /DNA_ORIENTATION=+